jgi:hypothetical protein
MSSSDFSEVSSLVLLAADREGGHFEFFGWSTSPGKKGYEEANERSAGPPMG